MGALYVRKGTGLVPVLTGGPQEREKRPGTENIAAAVGFGVAATLAAQEIEVNVAHCLRLTTRLWQGMLERIANVSLNSPERDRLSNTLNIGVAGATGEGLMM